MIPIKTKMRSHKYSIVYTDRHVLICDGKPLPKTGPLHTIDFYGSDSSPSVRASYTHFGEDVTFDLCEMIPEAQSEKRYSALQWWERLSPNHKRLVKDWVNDDGGAEWIEGLISGASYLHGFRIEALDFLVVN